MNLFEFKTSYGFCHKNIRRFSVKKLFGSLFFPFTHTHTTQHTLSSLKFRSMQLLSIFLVHLILQSLRPLVGDRHQHHRTRYP